MGKSQFRTRDRVRIRRLLQALPDEVNAEINAAYQKHAPAILAKARSEVPTRTGRLRAALSFKIMRATKSRPQGGLRVGLLTKAIQRKFFYARILEYGRKAKTVLARRKTGTRYRLRITPIAAGRYDFVRGRTLKFMQDTLLKDMRGILRRGLRKVGGAG